MIDEQSIRAIPRFSGIQPDLRQAVAAVITRQKLDRGDLLFQEGEGCKNLYLVETGVLKVFSILESGRELILSFVYPGEPVGEVALIDEAEMPATAAAHAPATVLVLPGHESFALMKTHPELALAAVRDLSMRMRSLRDRIMDLGNGTVENRLAHVLLALGARLGSTAHGGIKVPIALTRQELAAMVGARIETVIRVMSRWQKDDLVHTLDDGFLIPKVDALGRLSQPEG